MYQQITLALFMVLSSVLAGCFGQTKSGNNGAHTSNTKNKNVGGGCEGCELMYVGIPAYINATDTSVAWSGPGQKLLVTGKVFKPDGKTPAPGIIIYYWQTDNNGYYTPDSHTPEKAKSHGRIRGWVKTDAQGNYSIYTIRPAPYPNEKMPAHIHTSIKEPEINNEYYLDDFVFDDDPLLTTEIRDKLENRGGSGILKVVREDDMLVATHNIVLGLNIPDYPSRKK